jgi:2-amino-4-hydroxy-6-hydroxymethyldihydropteridine diphosphokinase
MEYALSLGSNLGRRLDNLRAARQWISQIPGISLIAQSRVYETEPVGVAVPYRRRRFLNAVLIVEGRLPLARFGAALRAIEARMGRTRSGIRNAPRVIDIDIIYAGAKRGTFGAIAVPHPRWSERRFVVQPLCDVRPSRLIPGAGATVETILAALPRVPRVKLYNDRR